MLNKIVVTRSFVSRIYHHLTDRIKLVIARKDHSFFPDSLIAKSLFLNLNMDEPCQYIQKAVTLKCFFPEISGLIATRIIRVPCAACVAFVKRQEAGTLAVQTGGHVNFIRINGKMDQRAFLELENQIPGVTIMLILIDSASPRLACHRVLEFDRDKRYAVYAQDHIKRIAMPGAVL